MTLGAEIVILNRFRTLGSVRIRCSVLCFKSHSYWCSNKKRRDIEKFQKVKFKYLCATQFEAVGECRVSVVFWNGHFDVTSLAPLLLSDQHDLGFELGDLLPPYKHLLWSQPASKESKNIVWRKHHWSMGLTLRRLMLYIYIYIYIYGAPILDVSRSHTTTQHSR